MSTRSLKEIQDELKEVQSDLDNLIKRKHQLEDEFDKVNCGFLHLQVGNMVATSNDEIGEVVSINGPSDCKYIVLIHRNDVGRDDIAMFNEKGVLYGYNNQYTITKI